MALYPADCAIGKTYFYPAKSSIDAYLVATANNAVPYVAADTNQYACTLIDDSGSSNSGNVTLETPVVTPDSVLFQFQFITGVTGAGNGLGTMTAFQFFKYGVHTVQLSAVRTFTGSLLSVQIDVTLTVLSNASTLYSAVIATLTGSVPYSNTLSGTIKFERVEGATTTFNVYYNGTLVNAYDTGGVAPAEKITNIVKYTRVGEWVGNMKYSELYAVGASLPSTCYGTNPDRSFVLPASTGKVAHARIVKAYRNDIGATEFHNLMKGAT